MHVRDSIPADEKYLRDIGRATYNFAYLEWGIVWLTETLEPGFLSAASSLTAGQIAKRFLAAARRVPDSESDQTSLAMLAENFQQFVEDRNRLVHGNPFTAVSGEQRLLYSGKHGEKDWTPELVWQFSDTAAILGSEAGRLLHSRRYENWKKTSQQNSK